jgi:hypothetical protein
MDILSRIIKHESHVFEEYCTKRKLLLKSLSEIKTSKLNKEQLEIFVYDIKAIIDPVKTSISEIDYYFTNTDFKKRENLIQFNEISRLAYLLVLGLYSPRSDTLETLETETSSDDSDSKDSESDPEPESDSVV